MFNLGRVTYIDNHICGVSTDDGVIDNENRKTLQGILHIINPRKKERKKESNT